MTFWMNPNKLRRDGLSHVLETNKANMEMCTANKDKEKPRERKIPSPTNLQFTVHLNINCLVSSNALEAYPLGLL